MTLTWEAMRERLAEADAIKVAKKIDKMHLLYGQVVGQLCRDCVHLASGNYHGTLYHKCSLYGMTHGPGTDWKLGYPACGKFEVVTE